MPPMTPKECAEQPEPWVTRTSPCDSQSYDVPKSQRYNALKVRFSATVGEEQEVEVGLG